MDMVNSLSVSNTTILAVTSRRQERSAIAGPQQVGTSAGYTGLSYNRKGPRTPIVDPFLVCLNHVKDTPKKNKKNCGFIIFYHIPIYPYIIPISVLIYPDDFPDDFYSGQNGTRVPLGGAMWSVFFSTKTIEGFNIIEHYYQRVPILDSSKHLDFARKHYLT